MSYGEEEHPDEQDGHRERDEGQGEGGLGGPVVAREVAALAPGDLEAAAEALEEGGEREAQTVAEADEVVLVGAALTVRGDGERERGGEEQPHRPERGRRRAAPVAPEGPAEEGADG